MITRWKLITSAAALAVVAGLSTSAFASVSPGDFTTATVSPLAPFGSIQVDTSARGMVTLSRIIGGMSDAEVTEVNQRCAVVRDARALYDQQTIAFCDSFYFAQGYDFDEVSD